MTSPSISTYYCFFLSEVVSIVQYLQRNGRILLANLLRNSKADKAGSDRPRHLVASVGESTNHSARICGHILFIGRSWHHLPYKEKLGQSVTSVIVKMSAEFLRSLDEILWDRKGRECWQQHGVCLLESSTFSAWNWSFFREFWLHQKINNSANEIAANKLTISGQFWGIRP